MENILTIINGIAWFSAALGAAVSAIFVVYAGLLFMSAQGDPQKMAQARGALIGVAVGLTIIGGGFIIPATISRYVIEPAGGIRVDPRAGVDCDGLLKDQLVFQRNAKDPARMQFVVSQIQGKREGCSPEFWKPQIEKGYGYPAGCYDVPDWKVNGVLLPDSLRPAPGQVPSQSTHDSDGNILVYFVHPNDTSVANVLERGLPSDGAVCWMYVTAFSAWAEGYIDEGVVQDQRIFYDPNVPTATPVPVPTPTP